LGFLSGTSFFGFIIEEEKRLVLILLLLDKLKSNISKEPPFFLKIFANSSKVFLDGS